MIEQNRFLYPDDYINKIILGDCLEVMKGIPDNVVDLVLTDPPYGTTACKWDTVIPFEPMWEQLKRITKKNGAIVLFGIEPFSSFVRISNINNYRHEWYWDKVIGANFVQVKHHPLKIIENIIVFSSGRVNYYPQMTTLTDEQVEINKAKTNKREDTKQQNVDDKYFAMSSGRFERSTDYKLAYPKNLLQYNKFNAECNPRNRLHPMQKPIALFEYLIKTYTNEKEIVLDFCIGSGTTAIACINTNRKYIGIEKDEKYYNIAQQKSE